MGCLQKEMKLMHQSGRTFVLYIYALVNTFHHNSSKVLACDVPPFQLEIPFGPSMFVSELGEPGVRMVENWSLHGWGLKDGLCFLC
jgi:hypothetical protein